MNEINAILSHILTLQEELIVAKHHTQGLRQDNYHRVVAIADTIARECSTLPYHTEQPIATALETNQEAAKEIPSSVNLPVLEEEKPSSPNTKEEKEEPSTHKTPLRRILLNINDRFLFRRELFSNNDEAMKNVLREIEQLNTLEEATELLTNRLDNENETTQIFISVIEKHFK